ncbi:hypothetical protein GHT06_009012 [Daphnia sinensis]|uniref:Uncharacterized protein n=1 Tax=Daphnia sinensis TaxID=1820382 RepID=A0AAD5Q2R9_9CRUS|nr:hypothetical protein GHT06_009012 [Daphnia sinensis]
MFFPRDSDFEFFSDILQSRVNNNIRGISYGRCLNFKVTLRVERNVFRYTIENFQSDRYAITMENTSDGAKRPKCYDPREEKKMRARRRRLPGKSTTNLRGE